MGRAPRSAVWAWRAAWVAAAVAAVAVFGRGFVANLRPDPDEVRLDFFQDWASARFFRDGLPLYEDRIVAAERYLGFAPGTAQPGGGEPNAHPPPSILLALPFAWLDYPDAFLAWNLVSLAAFALTLTVIVRQLGLTVSAWDAFPLIALGLLCEPLRQQLIEGQLNLVLLLLVTAAWADDRSGNPTRAGVWLGVAAALKMFPAFLFLYFLVRRRWSALAGGTIAFLVLTGLSSAVLGLDAYRDYVRVGIPYVAAYRSSWLSHSIATYWSRLFDPGNMHGYIAPLVLSPTFARALTLGCVALVVVSVAWKTARAKTRGQFDQAFGLAVIGMLLAAPVTWSHSGLLLVLPVILLHRELARSGAARVAFVAAVVVWWLGPAPWWYLILGIGKQQWMHVPVGPAQSVTGLAVPFYALIVLFVLSLTTTSRDA